MTSYKVIFENFIGKIHDIKLLSLSDDDIVEMCNLWMKSSIAKFISKKSDMSKRDDTLQTFTISLLDIEIEILSSMMVGEWLEPQLNSTLLTQQMYGSKEEKFYAQSNQLEKLMQRSHDLEVKMPKLMNSYNVQAYVSGKLS